MTLTNQQIDELFRFCAKKYVHHYDLQLELVDHLAERIEEKMTADKELSFEEALKKVYEGFGLFGFAHIVRQKTEALQKQRNREWRQAAKSFFTIPKLLLTLALFSLFLALGKWMPPEARVLLVDGLWIACYIHLIVQFQRVRKPLKKRLMLTEYDSIPFFFTPFIFCIELPGDNVPGLVGFALLCLAAIIINGACAEVNAKVYRQAAKLYPEAFKTA